MYKNIILTGSILLGTVLYSKDNKTNIYKQQHKQSSKIEYNIKSKDQIKNTIKLNKNYKKNQKNKLKDLVYKKQVKKINTQKSNNTYIKLNIIYDVETNKTYNLNKTKQTINNTKYKSIDLTLNYQSILKKEIKEKNQKQKTKTILKNSNNNLDQIVLFETNF